MAGQALEIAGAVAKTTQGNVDKYYDNDGNGWATLSAAKAGVPAPLRLRKTVLIDANATDGLTKATFYWWPGPGVADTDLVPYSTGGGTGTLAATEYAPGLAVTAGQILMGDGITVAVLYDLTTAGTNLFDEWNLPENHWNYRLGSEGGALVDHFAGVASGTAQVYARHDSSYKEHHSYFQAGKTFGFSFGAEDNYLLYGRVLRSRLFIPAGTTLSIGTNHHYYGELPASTAKLYPVDTVLDFEFIADRDPLDGVVKFRWLQPADNSGTDLTALPGYADPAKNTLLKDAAGLIYWGAGGTATAPTSNGPAVYNLQATPQSSTTIHLSWTNNA